jgi:hypothetical protein
MHFELIPNPFPWEGKGLIRSDGFKFKCADRKFYDNSSMKIMSLPFFKRDLPARSRFGIGRD